ncbi:uncharacterized protein LOC110733229 [Chenopodium quinoa]|uniref:uncharacterized protein LOC110733229 n=1 Tax=Chenopodium quinoa TaxID=63459 RepID=UPI000B780C72|nr:uncharacterized protein LOC110733229 [Chenopodium quinoa]
MAEVSDCPWCVGCPKSLQQALFDCPIVRDLWVDCDCTEMSLWPTGMTFLELFESLCKLEKKKLCRGAILLWNIWNRRNDMIFNGKDTYPLLYARQIYGGGKTATCRSSKKWVPPPEGTIKLNCNASLNVEGWVGLGVVAWDWQGEVLSAASRRTRAYWPPVVAESKAATMAVRLAKRFGLKDITLEADDQVLISRLSKASVYLTDLDTILDEILSSCNSVLWYHVKRDGNSVAHNLARVLPYGVEQVWENLCPCEVSPFVLMDKLSI